MLSLLWSVAMPSTSCFVTLPIKTAMAKESLNMSLTFIEHLLDSVSEKLTMSNLVSDGTNFVPPSQYTD